MPLFSISPNIQETEAASTKRIQNEYSEDIPFSVAARETPQCENLARNKALDMSTSAIDCSPQLPSIRPVPSITMDSPPGSSPAALTEAGSSTPSRNSPSPNITPSKAPLPQTSLSTQPDQPASAPMPSTAASKTATTNKGKRKTAEELEQERVEKKQKQDEKDALRAAKAAEKARIDAEKEALRKAKEAEKEAKAAEKAKIEAEREAVKKAKEAERQAKAAEKAKIDAEKEAKRRKKEEEELAMRRKTEKQQSMLASFVKRGPATPVKKKADTQSTENPSVDSGSPLVQKEAELEVSAYDRQFKPFFVKPGVKLAPPPFEMDEETKELKSRVLDEFIQHKRGNFDPIPFNPVETFRLNGLPLQRGIMPPSVKEIMEQAYGDPVTNAFGGVSIKTESQAERLSNVQEKLNVIPMKYLFFSRDVRPPYFGTVTTRMWAKTLRKLCRNPTERTLNHLNYDYDSEAEWVEEEGEDLDDCEDDEEDHDGDEEMEDFLDDSEDAVAANRQAFLGEMPPSSTGICFENRKRLGPCAALYKYKLEFLLDALEHHNSIDPFSSAYWEPKTVISTENGATPASTTATGAMAPPAPKGAFSRLTSSSSASAAAVDVKDLVPKEVLEDFKQTIISEPFREHTKSTVIDLLSKKFTNCTKAQIKTTLDKVAQRVSVPGEKKTVKHWSLLA
ncbi:hypothetical protein DL764_008006 [Monosporascus ibericus]|uniref:Chromatin assembly factor 1 subunit A n=1 Tax=Monosporascus ibericus TaxID=155417 RepID=A0A4Q4T0S3_9PEZI|nr:hypothetical protein DL764_008006 [Monosporascus ibericus]